MKVPNFICPSEDKNDNKLSMDGIFDLFEEGDVHCIKLESKDKNIIITFLSNYLDILCKFFLLILVFPMILIFVHFILSFIVIFVPALIILSMIFYFDKKLVKYFHYKKIRRYCSLRIQQSFIFINKSRVITKIKKFITSMTYVFYRYAMILRLIRKFLPKKDFKELLSSNELIILIFIILISMIIIPFFDISAIDIGILFLDELVSTITLSVFDFNYEGIIQDHILFYLLYKLLKMLISLLILYSGFDVLKEHNNYEEEPSIENLLKVSHDAAHGRSILRSNVVLVLKNEETRSISEPKDIVNLLKIEGTSLVNDSIVIHYRDSFRDEINRYLSQHIITHDETKTIMQINNETIEAIRIIGDRPIKFEDFEIFGEQETLHALDTPPS